MVLTNKKIVSPFSIFLGAFLFLGGFAVISASAETVITPDGTIENNIQDYSLYGPSAAEKVTLQKEVVYLTNQERLKYGLMPLKDDSTTTTRLHAASTWYAQWLTDNNWFSHDEPNGRDPGRRISDFGYTHTTWAENIGAGYTTPERAVAGWMGSQGHRGNILNSSFCELGVGLGYNDNYNFWYNGVHYQNVKRAWVQNFGCRSGLHPLIINAEAPSTTSRSVNMHVYGQGWAAHMRFSNDGVNWSSWEGYRNTKSWTLTPGDGTKKVYMQLMNRYGQIRSANDSIHLDDPTPVNESPTVNLVYPKASYTYTDPANVYIRADASDSDGSISKVEFYHNGRLIYTDYYSTYSHSLNSVPAGTHTFVAKAYDNKGATSLNQVTITVKESPNQAPSITLDSPADGYEHKYPKSIELKATATDPEGKIAKVEFYQDDQLFYTDYDSPYAVNKHDVTQGEHTFHAKVYDERGATAISKNKINLFKPNEAPTVSLVSPVENVYPAPATANIIVEASDPDGTISKVEMYQNNILVHTDYSHPYQYKKSGVPSGKHSFYAKAYDDKGAVTTSNVRIMESNELGIPNLVNPVNNEEFILGETVTLDVEVADKEGDTPYAVLFYQNNKYIGYDMSYPYSLDWEPTEAGSYDIKIMLMNYNFGYYTYDKDTNISVVEDTNEPPTGSLSLSHSTREKFWRVDFYLNASDPDGKITKVDYYANDKLVYNVPESKIAVNNFNGFWAAQSAGNYQIKARIYDDKGAFSDSNVANLEITAGNERPIIHITSPTPNTPTENPYMYGNTHYIKNGESLTLRSNAYDPDGQVRYVIYYLINPASTNRYLGYSFDSSNDYEVNIPATRMSTYLSRMSRSGSYIKAIAYDYTGLRSRMYSFSHIYLSEDKAY
jgi:uncharacterized protein YkwD